MKAKARRQVLGFLMCAVITTLAFHSAGCAGRVPGDIIVDNANPEFEIIYGDHKDMWKTSTRDPGYEGPDYLWARETKENGVFRHTGRASGIWLVRWKLKIPRDGRYRVLAKWVASKPDDRATNTPYHIIHRDGQTLVRVNQADLSRAGKWNELGVFNFAAGHKAQVILSSAADNTVVADAVKLVYVGEAEPERQSSDDFARACAGKGRVVFADDFSGGLQNWIFEGAGEVAIRQGRLHIKPNAMPGHMAWIRSPAPEAFRLEFDLTPLSPSGSWLVFFCATMPAVTDVFDADLPPREGVFARYVNNEDFQCYHISYRRGESPTCNLRKNPGKVLVKQTGLEGVMPAGRTYHLTLTYKAGHIKLQVDDKVYMDYQDTENVYGAGHIALRNLYACETEYDNVVIYDITGE